MDIPHSDFLVTLGTWGGGAGGTDEEKIGTFIHELGHNLGLTHGGSDHENYKPNHLSVMNYFWQTRGLRRNGSSGHFEYQRFEFPALPEPDLDEAVGLNNSSPALAEYDTRFFGPDRLNRYAKAAGSVDWNIDGDANDRGIAVDLNDNGVISTLAATPNEWNNLIYNGGAIGSTQELPQVRLRATITAKLFPFIELTEELNKRALQQP